MMRRINKYSIQSETLQEQLAAGRFNQALVLTYRGHRYLLSAGRSDIIRVYSDGPALLVLSINERDGYAGLQEFDKATGETLADGFGYPEKHFFCKSYPEMIRGIQGGWAI